MIYAHFFALDPRNLEIDQWSPQSSDDEYHESQFPISPDFDSYFEELLDPQLNGPTEAETWPDGLTPDWLLDISFNLLRPFKRPLPSGRYENTARRLGNYSFVPSHMQSTLGHAGKSICHPYEYQNFDFFGDHARQIGCGAFPPLTSPRFGPGNSEYGNFLVRNSFSRTRKSRTRRTIGSHLEEAQLQLQEMPTDSNICCNDGKIVSQCTFCDAQPTRQALQLLISVLSKSLNVSFDFKQPHTNIKLSYNRSARCKECFGVGQVWIPCRRCYIFAKDTQPVTSNTDDNYELDSNGSANKDVIASHVEDARSTVCSSAPTVSQTSCKDGLPVGDHTTVPEAQSTPFPVLGGSSTPSGDVNMLGSEADLEFRVFSVLGSDPGLAQAVIDRLQDQLPFISPLFWGVDDGSVLGNSPQYSSPVHESGSSRSPSATSSASQAKSSSTSSGMTPATSIASEKFGDEEDGDEKDSPSKDRPRKRQKVGASKQQRTTGRRRLRCHFHAKCPITHNQKACVMSGWLSIHNLRYDPVLTQASCLVSLDEQSFD